MAERDDIQLNYPVYFFDGLLSNENEQIWDISRSQLEMIDVEVSSSDDEVSLSGYDVDEVDDYEIDGKTETNEVCTILTPQKSYRKPKRPGKHFEMEMVVAKWCPHLECVLCKNLFPNFWMIKTHFSAAHPDIKPFIVCCRRKIFGRAQFAQHIHARHTQEIAKLADIKVEEYITFIQHYMPSMKCSICSTERANLFMLTQHFSVQHPNEVCSILCCQRRFARLSTIEEHIRCHLDANTFECALCEELFLTRLGLERHMAFDHYVSECRPSSDYYHPSISAKNTSIARLKYKDLDDFIAQFGPNLECKICSLSFLTFTSLKQHFKDTHPIDECQVLCCDIQFNNRHDLEEHLHFHRDTTGFKCQMCPNRFVKRSALYQHMYTKHPFLAVGTNDNLHYEENIRPMKSEVLKNYRELNLSLTENSLRKIDAIIAQHKLKVNCGECKKPLKSLTHLRNHFYSEHPEQKFYFSCCAKKLSTHYKFENHLKRHHNIQKKILLPVDSEHPSDNIAIA